MNITLDMLRESGLIVDWRSVYVAWSQYDISTRDVVDLAVERLGSGADAEEEYAIFRLADVEPEDRRDIERFLGRLAERSGVSVERALRKWRFAYLKWLLHGIGDEGLEFFGYHDLVELRGFWKRYEALPDSSRSLSISIAFDLEAWGRVLRELREWLREEEALIWAEES